MCLLFPDFYCTWLETKTRTKRCIGLVVVFVFLVTGTNTYAADWIVEVGGSSLTFSPAQLDINPGDTVTFINQGGVHNVVADDGSFRCAHGCDGDGMGGNGNASHFIWFATVAFPDVGSFGYFCETHGTPGTGMYGTITVAAAPPPPPPDATPGVPIGGLYGGIFLILSMIVSVAERMRRRSGATISSRNAVDHPRKPR